MKTKLPEELTSEVPQTKWGKILLATPVVMTVIATLLAGLASSEMTRAQYDRALGAQLQSKAGDQWGYFQAKKLRGAMQQNSFELLTATTDAPADREPRAGKSSRPRRPQPGFEESKPRYRPSKRKNRKPRSPAF
jgi:hypothetical protein